MEDIVLPSLDRQTWQNLAAFARERFSKPLVFQCLTSSALCKTSEVLPRKNAFAHLGKSPLPPTTTSNHPKMPTYDYECDACGHEFELFQSITEPNKRKCPECGKLKLRRLFGTGAAVVFKGSGFYETDYRSESYKKGAESAKKSSEKAKKSNDKSSKGEKSSTPKKDSPKKADSSD